MKAIRPSAVPERRAVSARYCWIAARRSSPPSRAHVSTGFGQPQSDAESDPVALPVGDEHAAGRQVRALAQIVAGTDDERVVGDLKGGHALLGSRGDDDMVGGHLGDEVLGGRCGCADIDSGAGRLGGQVRSAPRIRTIRQFPGPAEPPRRAGFLLEDDVITLFGGDRGGLESAVPTDGELSAGADFRSGKEGQFAPGFGIGCTRSARPVGSGRCKLIAPMQARISSTLSAEDLFAISGSQIIARVMIAISVRPSAIAVSASGLVDGRRP